MYERYKMTVEMICADYGACGQIRVNWPAQLMQSLGVPILNTRTLYAGFPLDAVFIQRCAEQPIFDILRKCSSTRIILDFDDLLFKGYGEGLPSYNHAKDDLDINQITECIKKNLDIIDKVVVSTDYLKNVFTDTFNFNRVEVIPNYLPRWMYHFDRKKNKTEDIVNPTVLYAGSSTHYSDTDTGDFNKSLIEFIKNNIDRINFVIVGNIPFFFKDIAHKIINIQPINILEYPLLINSLNADFIIAPLKENVFNKCKSNLKYLESCAVGSVMIGSSFADSPYNCIDERCKIQKTMTANQIDKMFWNLCKKDTYNEILTEQYNYMNENGWLENNVSKYTNLFNEKIVGI